LCERFGDLESNPLTIEVENNRIRALRSENKDLRDEFRATPAQTKTAIGSANLPSAPISPARISLGTLCRMKNFPAFTLPLVILTPNTPAQTGFPKLISTA